MRAVPTAIVIGSKATVKAIPQPTVETLAATRGYGRFQIAPLEVGMGVVLGTVLRRVLLSSLPGAAVTSIRISGVYHEFSPIPGVVEDVIAVMAQVKKLRLKLLEGESARLQLYLQGEGTVTAGDITCPSNVEIINPDLYLLTTDGANAQVDIELSVGRGHGYSPADERGRLPIGELPVDAIYSPIRRVAFSVERRERDEALEMEVWTDGTCSPLDALREAATILLAPLGLLIGIAPEGLALPKHGEAAQTAHKTEQDARLERPLEDLEFSVRVHNSLRRAGITTVGALLEILEKNGPDGLLQIRNFGDKAVEEVLTRLKERGFISEADNGTRRG